jgi:hypothetical protein
MIAAGSKLALLIFSSTKVPIIACGRNGRLRMTGGALTFGEMTPSRQPV